ncbi:hypothetical protein [Aquisphaera insulae]|uniref:hypothetical protein n=1 Tax=Aquisphaera insulae TaxID=2712864 RepID=UPI0013EAF075|nr:hypothetical protein [Aquisphaera insulae]
MNERIGSSRRGFLSGIGAAAMSPAIGLAGGEIGSRPLAEDLAAEIDFRHAPADRQTAFCFPDDVHKSLVGELGELRLGHPGAGKGGIRDFAQVARFSTLGMEPDVVVEQRIEAPGIPIVHTVLDRPQARMEITTFATREPGEGRVDNVLIEIRPTRRGSVEAIPTVTLRTAGAIQGRATAGECVVSTADHPGRVLLVADAPGSLQGDLLQLRHGTATTSAPIRHILRFPCEGQDAQALLAGLRDPGRLLEAARRTWRKWEPFAGEVGWRLPTRYDEFLVACARNILQARESRGGRLTFQVGPTVYRGLWVVDGHFLLEAARYLGHDREAQQGLESTWSRQEADGGIFAGGGRDHWKDTGIALFSLVRQAELAQEFGYFREMQPNVLRAVGFLKTLRDRAASGTSINGRYGLLPPGMGDGGLGGIRNEFTNTLWGLAGLKATLGAAASQGLSGFDEARSFFEELQAAFLAAARKEMIHHPGGFSFLPMVAKDDPAWKETDAWHRPRPQSGQWALSHAIFPGLLFDPNDPIVQGHIRLMQEVTREDVPIETGWLPHGGLWTYNAAFVAEAYLWAGLADRARSTFHGFLNHATPTWCWREEQPLTGSLVAGYVGDMPHNWASAECVRYLRHMLALEDGATLRLLAGIGEPELALGATLEVRRSPTRFGRVDVIVEPDGPREGCRIRFRRDAGPDPDRVVLPRKIGRLRFASSRGAVLREDGDRVLVEPRAREWEATWKG